MKKIVIILIFLICAIGTYAQNSSTDIAISRAKELFIATANGDVARIKKLTMPEFYKQKYPYSDAKVRELLLSVSYEKRQKLIDQIKNHCKASALRNRAGDFITVTLENNVTGKEFTICLLDEEENGNWRIVSYEY